MKVAIFPGSFDPFTRGHEAIVSQALTMFDKVVIAIGENITKQGFLSIEQRIRLIENLYAEQTQVEVKSYDCLTGELAQEIGACAIIRGVRNTIDFEYEKNMAQVNRRLFPQIATLLLFTPAELSDVSSSTIRELVTFNRDVSEMMPKGVKLEEYMTK